MKFLRGLLSFALLLSQLTILFNGQQASALSPNGIVISHVITGESVSSSSELVALYNNASVDVAVDGYCLKNKSSTIVACISADTNTKVYIKSHNYLTVASTVFASTHIYTPDTSFASSNAIQVGGDMLTLVDEQGVEIDRVTWGTSGGGISSLTNGTLQRKADMNNAGKLVDTDVMSADFTSLSTLTYPANASYDVVTIVDVCPNLSGIQTTMPVGYLADENAQCQPDSCVNIAGLQTNVPDHYDSDASGNCYQHDECDNLDGIQTMIPDNMERSDANNCRWVIMPIILTEILPNALGSDTGNEFIEIYNPTNQTVDLSLYSIKTGVAADKTFSFPVGATIAPKEYRAFTDTTMKFTLLNTSSRVVLTAVDGSVLGDTGTYTSPADGESWALIANAWQYTNQPTANAANQASVIEEITVDSTDSTLAACPAGKYRNPLTNRCRSIAADTTVLASCDSGQYRNPETGRCKKIETASLTPCKDGQYRSEETNRCRNIQTASAAKACKDNQYRSEETNRCRNLPVGTVPGAGFAVQPVKESSLSFVGWWALGLVIVLAAGYAVWEWRMELLRYSRSFISRFSSNK